MASKQLTLFNYQIDGSENVQRMFKRFPTLLRYATRKRFMAERKRYVGTRRHLGMIDKKIRRLKLSKGARSPFSRTGKWSNSFSKGFVGVVSNQGDLEGMRLDMGTWVRGSSKHSEIASKFEEGSGVPSRTVSRGGRDLIIPAYRNLAKRGIEGDYNENFHRLINSGRLNSIQGKKARLYFSADKGSKIKRGARKGMYKKGYLLYIGKKSIRFQKRIDFVGMVSDDFPSIVGRFRREVGRLMRGVERGYIKMNDSGGV